MRIERTGNVDPLTPRLKRFFVEALGGVGRSENSNGEESGTRSLEAGELVAASLLGKQNAPLANLRWAEVGPN